MAHRRRFRRPVLSRLTWAWLGALGVMIVLGGVFVHAVTSRQGPNRIALPINDMEYAAPAVSVRTADKRLPDTLSEEGLRLSPPGLRDARASTTTHDDMADGEEAKDILSYPDEDILYAENDDVDYSADDVTITIDGKLHGAAPVTMASLTPARAIAIPDPDPSLLRSTPLGKTPRIGADGRKALSYYANPSKGDPSKPRVAVIVGGLGLNPGLTERAIDDLPPEISLAFAPYAKNLEFWTQKARQAGHEILIELPMEGYGPNQDALGAASLMTTRTAEENLQRLDWLLSRFGGYFAATNYLGAKFSADETALKPVLQQLREAGVGYVDDTGAAARAGAQTGAAMASVNKIISPAADAQARATVERELRALESIAKRDGAALAKTYAYAETLEELAEWTDALEQKGFVIAPASALLRTSSAAR